MNNTLELDFINTYVVKEKKERLIYEFSNPKKRENALLRFSHNIESIVNDKFIKCRCNIDNINQFLDLFGDVYVVSLYKIGGEICSYKQAVAHLSEQYMPVIIIADNHVIIKSECDNSKDSIFILTQSTNR